MGKSKSKYPAVGTVKKGKDGVPLKHLGDGVWMEILFAGKNRKSLKISG